MVIDDHVGVALYVTAAGMVFRPARQIEFGLMRLFDLGSDVAISLGHDFLVDCRGRSFFPRSLHSVVIPLASRGEAQQTGDKQQDQKRSIEFHMKPSLL